MKYIQNQFHIPTEYHNKTSCGRNRLTLRPSLFLIMHQPIRVKAASYLIGVIHSGDKFIPRPDNNDPLLPNSNVTLGRYSQSSVSLRALS